MAHNLAKEFAIRDVQDAASRGLQAGLTGSELRWLFAKALEQATEGQHMTEPVFALSVRDNPPDFTSRRFGERI